MDAMKFVWAALMGDASPEERSRVLRLIFRIVVSVHIVWACGFLAPIGLSGFVLADGVDDKVQAAVEPLRAEISKVAVTQAQQELILRQIRADQITARLRELHLIECETADRASLERLAAEIETAERQYRELTGDRYPLDGCTR